MEWIAKFSTNLIKSIVDTIIIVLLLVMFLTLVPLLNILGMITQTLEDFLSLIQQIGK